MTHPSDFTIKIVILSLSVDFTTQISRISLLPGHLRRKTAGFWGQETPRFQDEVIAVSGAKSGQQNTSDIPLPE